MRLSLSFTEYSLQRSKFFLKNFRNNLLDIDEDLELFDTHFFRRDDVQYFSSELR